MVIEELNNEGIALLQVSEDSISTNTASNTLGATVEDVLKVWVELSSNDHEPFMRFLTRSEYYDISDKETTGTPYECYIEYSNPRKIILWPAPSETLTIKYLKVSKISSLDSATSVVEYEKRYYTLLVYRTCLHLSTVFNLSQSLYLRIFNMENKALRNVKNKEIRSQTGNALVGAY